MTGYWIVSALAISALSTLGSCSGGSQSKTAASNTFENQPTPYWYQTFSPREDAANSLVKLYQDQPHLLLQNPEIPGTLEGLWYMDGAPYPDQTLSFVKTQTVGKSGDFRWQVTYPLQYTWRNEKAAHGQLQQFRRFDAHMTVRFMECPADVVAERQAQGHPRPHCSRSDQEYAQLVPSINLLGLNIAIPQDLIYYDVYLRGRPLGQDYLVWERRSRLMGALKDTLSGIGMPEQGGYHRYAFTQVLDAHGNVLSSYPRFAQIMAAEAREHGIAIDQLLAHVCFPGFQGCKNETIRHRVATDRRRQFRPLLPALKTSPLSMRQHISQILTTLLAPEKNNRRAVLGLLAGCLGLPTGKTAAATISP